MYTMNNSCYKLFMKKYDKTNFDSNCQLLTKLRKKSILCLEIVEILTSRAFDEFNMDK